MKDRVDVLSDEIGWPVGWDSSDCVLYATSPVRDSGVVVRSVPGDDGTVLKERVSRLRQVYAVVVAHGGQP